MSNGEAAWLRSSRRHFLIASASIALGPAASAARAQTKAPVRIGVINTFTGVTAVSADSNFKGMNLYFDSIDRTVAGRKIELLQEDDQFNPQIGLQKVRKLVESDHVDVICGPQGSNVALAILNYLKETKTPMLVWAGTDSITYGRLPFVFRPALTSWQLSTPIADWVHANLAQEIVLIGADFAAGRDVMTWFKSVYLPKGGKVLKEIYPPVGANDYSPYLTDIRGINPPAVYAFFTGTDAVRFVQQFAQAGLSAHTRLTGFAPLVDGSTIGAQGDAALGVITPQIYVDTLDNPENKAFVGAYRARFQAYPDTYSVYGYDTAHVIASALAATGGNTGDRERLEAAIANAAFASPRGPFRFDPATRNPIQNVYMTEVARLDGRLANKVIATIKNVRDPNEKPS